MDIDRIVQRFDERNAEKIAQDKHADFLRHTFIFGEARLLRAAMGDALHSACVKAGIDPATVEMEPALDGVPGIRFSPPRARPDEFDEGEFIVLMASEFTASKQKVQPAVDDVDRCIEAFPVPARTLSSASRDDMRYLRSHLLAILDVEAA